MRQNPLMPLAIRPALLASVWLLSSAAAVAQAGELQNPGFEKGGKSSPPPGWSMPSAGFAATVTDEKPFEGKRLGQRTSQPGRADPTGRLRALLPPERRDEGPRLGVVRDRDRRQGRGGRVAAGARDRASQRIRRDRPRGPDLVRRRRIRSAGGAQAIGLRGAQDRLVRARRGRPRRHGQELDLQLEARRAAAHGHGRLGVETRNRARCG